MGAILERYAAVNVGYEPMVFEYIGDTEEGGYLIEKYLQIVR